MNPPDPGTADLLVLIGVQLVLELLLISRARA